MHRLNVKDNFDGVIFDLDGVLEYQGKVYPGAGDLLDYLRQRDIQIRILSNSTLKSRASCTENLNKKGFAVYQHEVNTASYTTAKYLENLDPKSCWIMLRGEGLKEFGNLRHDPEKPEYVVLGDFRDGFNFKNLNKALRLLDKGAKLIVMITERTDSSLGELELTVGAYGRMLEDASGIRATYIGKPNSYIFDITLDTMVNIDRNRILMIGDKINTDILGASKAGLKTALVKTGEFKQKDLESPIITPDYIFDSIHEIMQAFKNS
jgi:HAD superfamily hydrolase (TIGR01458 family)